MLHQAGARMKRSSDASNDAANQEERRSSSLWTFVSPVPLLSRVGLLIDAFEGG
jgi:hypothetical protein